MKPPNSIASPDLRATAEGASIERAYDQLEAARRAASQPAWLASFRAEGLARFRELGFPTLEDEDWRYTNVAPIQDLPFRPASVSSAASVPPELLPALPLAGLPGDRLVFIDGHFVPHLSQIGSRSDGVRVTQLASALATSPGLVEKHFTSPAAAGNGAFSALNQAFFQDGALIHLPAGRTVAEPIRLVFIGLGQEAGSAIHLRNLIIAGKGSQATVIEHYVGLGTEPGLTNSVTELVAEEGVVLEHLKLQDEPASIFHVASLRAVLGRGSNVISHSFALGAKLSRQNITGTLDGEGSEAVFNGLFLGDGDRLIDHHMTVNHVRPSGASHEYFNGILADRSHGVFYGRIHVYPQAQKTDAKQTNKNLLLSEHATVHTRPQLEIYADDVKCTHGATVGQLNAESIFYLRARGIPRETARRILIRAFAGEIIDRVRCEPAREVLDRLVWERLERVQPVGAGG